VIRKGTGMKTLEEQIKDRTEQIAYLSKQLEILIAEKRISL
jgi:hypothetical protein